MKEKDQLFAVPVLFAFSANIASIISTRFLIMELGLGIEGNPIYRKIFAFSPWLAFVAPFIILVSSTSSIDGTKTEAWSWLEFGLEFQVQI